MSPDQALANVPLRTVETSRGRVQYRHAGDAAHATHVLLHGIGSASASWMRQLAAVQGRADLGVLAWEAPGYGQSQALSEAQPQAVDYAQSLWAWLDALNMAGPVRLVGHSLGALMAAAAARLQAHRVQGLVLLAPARGYGDAEPAERERVLQSRLKNLQALGPEGMARQRAAAMLSPNAPAALVEAVRANMAAIHPAGYTQATHMLAQGRLIQDLLRLPQAASGRIWVASGEADGITPPDACDAVAQALGQSRLSLGPVGHACPLEAADAVNALLGLPSGVRA